MAANTKGKRDIQYFLNNNGIIIGFLSGFLIRRLAPVIRQTME